MNFSEKSVKLNEKCGINRNNEKLNEYIKSEIAWNDLIVV